MPPSDGTARLRLRDGVITLGLAGAIYLGLPLVAVLIFGSGSLAIYIAAFLLAPALSLIALAWPLRIRGCDPAELGLTRPATDWLLRAGFTLLIVIPGSAAMALLIETAFDISFEDVNESLYALGELGPAGLVVAGIGIVLLAPVAEELLLRGTLYGGLRRHLGPVMSVTISAAFFAVLHAALAVMPIIFALGLILGWLRHRSGSVLPGILLHALNNAWAFGLYLVQLRL